MTSVVPERASAAQSGPPPLPAMRVTSVTPRARFAVGDRNTDRGRHADAGGDAVHHLDLDAGRRECLHFLAAASEHEGIAALDPCDRQSAARQPDHLLFDERLRRRAAASAFPAALADRQCARRGAGIGSARRLTRSSTSATSACPSARTALRVSSSGIARPGADQIDFPGRVRMIHPHAQPVHAASLCVASNNRFSSGTQEPHCVPQRSVSCKALRLAPRSISLRMSPSATSTQMQTMRPRLSEPRGARRHRREHPRAHGIGRCALHHHVLQPFLRRGLAGQHTLCTMPFSMRAAFSTRPCARRHSAWCGRRHEQSSRSSVVEHVVVDRRCRVAAQHRRPVRRGRSGRGSRESKRGKQRAAACSRNAERRRASAAGKRRMATTRCGSFDLLDLIAACFSSGCLDIGIEVRDRQRVGAGADS